MPEAPEIFYLKELIKSKINGNIFENIISNTKSKVNLPEKSKVINCDCKGKLLWIQTEKYYVHLHMMISGWLVFEKPKICKYEFVFDNMTIYMDDTRRFSKVQIVNTDAEHDAIINQLGLSFLRNEVSKENFVQIITSTNKNISSLLLDQKVFCGVGNYIRNEALYMVKIHPNIKANEISESDAEKLYEKIRYVMFSNLCEMLKDDDLKIPKNIKDISPKKLQIPYKFRVYDREKDDKGNKITREKMAGRWTYYVKSIQKIN
jgi:formamidopyrimidine-DNA glycosylase